MRVLLDIQVLGGSHARINSRRGIFRYIECLAKGLAQLDDPALDLTFCTSKNWHYVYQCLDYLEAVDGWNQYGFAQPDSAFMRRLSRRMAQLDQEAKFESSGIKCVGKKAARESLRSLFNVHTFFRGDVLDQKYIPEADIFHSPHFLSMPPQARNLACAKNFVTVHDIIPLVTPQYENKTNSLRFKKKLEVLNKEDWIFAVSQYSADDLCNYCGNIDPDKVMAVPLAAADHFRQCKDQETLRATRATYGIPAQSPYLLSLSALEPRKNFEATIRSFQDVVLQNGMDDLFLVLVGQEVPGFQSHLEDLVESEKVRKKIIFTGFVLDEDLSPIYSDAAAFLFPSFYEGFGLPPLEAMKCGSPVIVSNRASIPEIVGDAGIYIDPTSVDELSQAVLRVMGDSDLRQELSRKSLARADEFSWERHAEMTVAGYRKALGSS
jgi:glycosyltransferase involved in cell wall biosynthesis